MKGGYKMKSKLIKMVITISAALFTFFALSTSASACGLALYQKEEPKCLYEN